MSRISGAAPPPNGERRLIAEVLKSDRQRIRISVVRRDGRTVVDLRIVESDGRRQFVETRRGFTLPTNVIPETIRGLVDALNIATAGGPQSPPAEPRKGS